MGENGAQLKLPGDSDRLLILLLLLLLYKQGADKCLLAALLYIVSDI